MTREYLPSRKPSSREWMNENPQPQWNEPSRPTTKRPINPDAAPYIPNSGLRGSIHEEEKVKMSPEDNLSIADNLTKVLS